MRRSIKNIIKLIFIVSLAVMITGCSLMSEISSSLIELNVTYNEQNYSEDIGEIYFRPIDEQHIAVNENSISYIDNEVLIVVAPNTMFNEVEALAEKYGGEVVGCIEKTGDYQLLLNTDNNIDGINSLAAKLEGEDIVISAYPNYVAVYSENSINYGDKWKNDLNKPNDCKGKSWGVEAINAPAAWELLENNSDKVNKNLRIGLIDNGFDLEHEDLGFAYKFPNYNVSVKQDGKASHGTHVAGTMAASSDNKKGICGVYPYGNGNLYGISYNGITEHAENKASLMMEKIALAELILRNVKVINASYGNMLPLPSDNPEKNTYIPSDVYIQYRDSDNEAKKQADKASDIIANYLQSLIKMGYDFVIVNSAGNESHKQYKTSEEDVFSVSSVDAKYNGTFSAISLQKYPDVYNRIIVVGSVNGNYLISNFSCVGDRVDVFAPGENIYSTKANNKYGNTYKEQDGKKGTWDGTSMAAPHVAGVAAMVWAANSDLTGEMVKLIVCGRTTDKGTGINIVDAQKAVSYALNKDLSEWAENNKTDTPDLGSIMSYVVTADTNEERISNALVEAINVSTNKVFTTKTDNKGHYELFLDAGEYKITVSAEGYYPFNYSENIMCTSQGVTYADWPKLKSKKQFVDYFYGKTIGDVITYCGEEYCHEYLLTHGGLGIYVPFLKYVFIPEKVFDDSIDKDSKIVSVQVLEGGEMFSGAVIGDTAVVTAKKSGDVFNASKIEVSDVNGNYVYIDHPNENITYYMDMNESPSSSKDKVEKHMQTMISKSGLAKFSYATVQPSQKEETSTTVVATETTQTSTSKEQEINIDEEWIEYARSQVTKHYKDESGLTGEFVCFSDEDIIEKEYVKFILRYSHSREECDEIIANGGMPSSNVYQSLIEIEVKTGKVTDESGNVWYLNDASSSQSTINVQSEVNRLSVFIDFTARYDASFLDTIEPTDSDKWNTIYLLAYANGMTYVDESTIRQWLKNIYNDETIPSLNDTFPSINRKDLGYEFAFGDSPELDVEYENIIENIDGTISAICNVYTPFQTNTRNECEYGLLKKCEVILVIDNTVTGPEKLRIDGVKRIASYKYAGSCGENVMYAIDENDVAYIYGDGRMNDYSFTTASGIRSSSPFSEGADPIVNFSKIIIEEGVTYIGTCTFPADCGATEIYFPKSVTEMGSEVIRTFQGTTDVWDAGLSISKNYTIYCYKDSYVHQYAIKHNLKYELR